MPRDPSRSELAKNDRGSKKKCKNVTPCDKPCITLFRNQNNAAREWVNKRNKKNIP
jgi:hypothetical protein